jgi:hypothetical protein
MMCSMRSALCTNNCFCCYCRYCACAVLTAQPYIEWADIPQQQQQQQQQQPPQRRRTIAAPQQLLPPFTTRVQHLHIQRSASPLKLSWRLGGCFSVDSTRLLLGRYDGDSDSSSAAGSGTHSSGSSADDGSSSSSGIDGTNNATLAAQAIFATPDLFGDCR